MKVRLMRNGGKSVGYTMTPESQEEQLILGSIRQMYFWGSGEDSLKYDGIQTDGNYVTQMSFCTEAQKARNIKNTVLLEKAVPNECLLCGKPIEVDGRSDDLCNDCWSKQ